MPTAGGSPRPSGTQISWPFPSVLSVYEVGSVWSSDTSRMSAAVWLHASRTQTQRQEVTACPERLLACRGSGSTRGVRMCVFLRVPYLSSAWREALRFHCFVLATSALGMELLPSSCPCTHCSHAYRTYPGNAGCHGQHSTAQHSKGAQRRASTRAREPHGLSRAVPCRVDRHGAVRCGAVGSP